MALLDFLIGGSSLKRQRDKNIDSAREMYDPSVFNPVMNEQRQRAVEGIPQGQRDIARQRTIQQLFRPQDNAIYGGNQAAAIAGNQAQSANASQALAGFEGQLQSQQIQTQQQAREQFARTSSQAMQMANQRDASIDQIESQYEAERSRRKQGLASAAFGLIGSAVTTPFGPAGQTLAGKALGSVFGGDDNDSELSAGATPSVEGGAGVGDFVQGIGDIYSPFSDGALPEAQALPSGQPQGQGTVSNTQPPSQQPTPAAQQQQAQSGGGGGFNMVQDMLRRSDPNQFVNPDIFGAPTQSQNVEQGRQQTELLGDRLLGDVPQQMGRIAGPIGEMVGQLSQGVRQPLNFMDIMARGVSEGLAEPERNEIAKLQELYGDNWEQEVNNLRQEFQGADLDDRYLRQLLLYRANQ